MATHNYNLTITWTGNNAVEPKVPWHFWLLLATAGLYLGWRALQGVGWLIDKV